MSAVIEFPSITRKPRMVIIYRPDGSISAWDRDMSLSILANRYGMAGMEFRCRDWNLELRKKK